MPEEMLLDTPEVDAIDTDVSSDVSEVESGDNVDSSTETTDVQNTEDSAPVISDANGQLKLSETARAQLDKIKAENPKLAREMRAALFDRQALLAKVPGGVKEALATIEAYEADGGSEAVQRVKEDLGMWQDLDADFRAGKQEFVNDISAGNPEAFVKLAPMVMQKFSEIASDLYSYEVAKVFSQDMAANEVALNMRLLQREISLLPEQSRGEIQKLWNTLAGYVDRVNGMARTPPKSEAKPTIANPNPTYDIDQREQALTIQEFASEKARVLDSVTSAEFKKNIGNRKATETQISAIQELYEARLDKMLRSDQNHMSKVDRFLAAKDKAGYAKHMAAAYRAKSPLAMEQAFKAVMPGKPGPIPAKPAAKPATAGKPALTTGFTRSATKPNHNDIDWQSTARIPGKKGGDGKFVMRDGSKVLYQR